MAIRPLGAARCLAVAMMMVSSLAAASRWTDASSNPNAAAEEAVGLLASAAIDGLDPRDYRAAELSDLLVGLRTSKARSREAVEAFETALDQELPRFIRHLHHGRVDPGRAGFRMTEPRDEHDFEAIVDRAVAEGRLAQAAAELAPPLPAYRLLRDALGRYRALAANPEMLAWQAGPTLHPGEHGAAVPALRRRLQALGDLAEGAQDEGERYDPAVERAVQRFQRRHGLQPDGVLGPKTQAALGTSVAQRVRQIELSMERLRWLPHLDGRFVGVNIPMFRLWAVEATHTSPLAMNVIVGRALDTRTPVFVARMRQVVFRPYWNVPRSIVRGELLPLLRRDPAYLARHDMEIVRGAGDDARVVDASPANLLLLRDGALRLRQRPGQRNALGLVKFVFPNDSDIYLHGTPTQHLFARPRRDFSHGCIRVEDPVALAEWLLRNQPPWSRERIAAAMNGERTQFVTLAQPLPVVLYYVTALATSDGSVRFADDVYGHDARLERALAGR
jgi:murein L,D-transpeptidase YcbB/YkuD